MTKGWYDTLRNECLLPTVGQVQWKPDALSPSVIKGKMDTVKGTRRVVPGRFRVHTVTETWGPKCPFKKESRTYNRLINMRGCDDDAMGICGATQRSTSSRTVAWCALMMDAVRVDSERQTGRAPCLWHRVCQIMHPVWQTIPSFWPECEQATASFQKRKSIPNSNSYLTADTDLENPPNLYACVLLLPAAIWVS